MIPIDLSFVGIVFTLMLFIIFFSAIVLYLAFRIKETFREEKRGGAVATKVMFLVGILFLAGGGFYFFAQALRPTIIPPPSTNGTSPSSDGRPELNLSISYPSQVRTNSEFTISFVITNPTEHVAHRAVIRTNTLLEDFNVVSSTHRVAGNTIDVGDVPPGTTTASLELRAPNRSQDIDDTITLTFQEATEPISQEVSITVVRRGR